MNAITGQSRPVLAPGVRMHRDAATGEPVLLFPEGVLFLNATAHEVAARLDGEATVDSMIAALAEEYEAGAETLRGDVMDCLSELGRRNLIAFKS
jgi:coenzyme PQQ biosynthesis protein PqqD